MKSVLLVIFCCIATCCMGQSVLDQRLDFSVSNTHITKALDDLRAAAGVEIAYSSRFFESHHFMEVSARDESLREILTRLLNGTGIGFKELGTKIVLYREKLPSAILSGYVVDSSSGEKLVSASIYCPALKRGTLANEYGFFSLKLEPGAYEIEFRHVGYVPRKQVVHLRGNEKGNFALPPAPHLPEVLISPPREDIAGLNSREAARITPEFVHERPALGGEADLVRATHLLPGVQAGVDGLAGLHVRGGDAGHNLMMLDGVPIFIPFHLLGAFSVYNNSTVKSAQLLKGGFSARYGGRLAGIYDVRTRDGHFSRWHAEASANLLNARAMVEGPLPFGEGGIVLSGRLSPGISIMQPTMNRIYFNDVGGKLETEFNDFNAKLNVKLGEKDRIYLSLFTGFDEFEKYLQEEGESEQVESESALIWENTTAALRWNHQLSRRMFANTTATYSRFRYQYSSFDRFTTIDSTAQQSLFFVDSRSENHHYALQSDFDFFPNDCHTIRFGAGLGLPDFQPGLTFYDQNSDDLSGLDSIYPGSIEGILSNGETIRVVEGNIYLEDRIQLGPRWTLQPGLRSSFYVQEEDFFPRIEPRLLAYFQPDPKVTLYASGSRMIQYQHLISNTAIRFPNDIWLPSTEDLPPQDAWMGEIGATFRPGERLTFSVDAYYKSMRNLYALPDSFSFLNSSTLLQPQNLVLRGSGTAYGIESAVAFQGRSGSGMLSYTYADTRRRFDGKNQGMAYPHDFDHRHQFKVFFTQRLGKRWRVGANWVYLSGHPRLNLTNVSSGIGLSSLDLHPPGQKNQVRSPDYHRLDLNLIYRVRTGPVTHTIKLGAYNVYDQKNVAYYRGTATGATAPVFAVPFTPSAFYSIRF